MTELLVVIAIIVILAVVSFTVYGKIMISTKSAASVNQLKQIALAIGSYTTEHGGKYPPSWYEPKNLTTVEFLGEYIYGSDFRVIETPVGIGSYLPPEQRLESVFISPFRKNLKPGGPWAHPHTYGPHPDAMISVTNATEANGTSPSQVHQSKVSSPHDFILYADIWTDDQGGGGAGFRSQPGMDGTDSLDSPLPVVNERVGALHYYHGRLHAIMGDLTVRIFKEGEVRKRNVVMTRE